MKKVSKQQIDRLYEFTRQHYVEYYDVQTELVDHLANAIEEHWEENPDQDFEELLQKEFKKFGVFGFMEVVEKRQNAMTKKYYKMILEEAKNFLKLPRVIFSAVLGWACFFVISEWKYGIISLAILFLALLISTGIKFGIKMRKRRKQVKAGNKKMFLLEDTIMTSGGLFQIFFLPFYFINFGDFFEIKEAISFQGQIFLTFVFTAEFLLLHISVFVIPSRKEEILKKAYPEMELS
ncbi:hypothetical protein [Mesonia maritima]|uniref:Uncharacterized protein n=1 Tax=Mesonia maritima TaxID=1793873 RepID=A0ABU1K5P5_9FLAO|nr:hypothetical protein [Mesonia maritima]MDR6299837.1 hypothetical protein [Mesonia maritima]